jgi:hypothetical protein
MTVMEERMLHDADPVETAAWLDALESVLDFEFNLLPINIRSSCTASDRCARAMLIGYAIFSAPADSERLPLKGSPESPPSRARSDGVSSHHGARREPPRGIRQIAATSLP